MNYKIKNICCIGAGYVGGPTMSVIANQCPHLEINVVDININRIQSWNDEDLSKLPVYEPGLDNIIKKCRGKNLHFSNDIEINIAKADIVFISVNTPTKEKGIGAGKASDLRWIEESTRQIAKYATKHTIVVEKSTLPVKTAKTIEEILNKSNISENEKTFSVLSNPEFLAEGTAINDLLFPDRVLIGGNDKDAIEALVNIYMHWVDKSKILTTNIWSSELSKLISNAFLAQRISSINSVSALCEKTGADVNEVSIAVGMDKRIGKFFLNAGPGFGGSCFKKDILNLVYMSDFYGLSEVSEYWQKVLEINIWQQKRIYRLIVEKLFNTVSGKKICILGFAFKANTNDSRESPAIQICKDLLDDGCNISIYDPKVLKETIQKDLDISKINYGDSSNHLGHHEYYNNLYEAARGSDAMVILTEWSEFKSLDFKKLSEIMRPPAWIFDTRSIIKIDSAKEFGINVWSIGKNN